MNKRNLDILLLVIVLVFSALFSGCDLFAPASYSYESDEEEQNDKKEHDEAQIEETDNQPESEIPDYMLVPIPIGSYVLYGIDGRDDYQEGDIKIEFIDEATGTMYYPSEYDEYDFTYTYADRILTINLDNGEVLIFETIVTEVADLWMTDLNAPEIRYYYYLDYEDIFTALGAWVTEYDDGQTGIISFWSGGRGYAANWQGVEGNLLVVEWEYSYGTLQVELNGEQYYSEEFGDVHRGDVLELSTANGEKLVHFRVNDELLFGYYFLQDSDSENFDIMELAIYENDSAKCVIYRDGKDTLYDNASWQIDKDSGKLIIDLGSESLYLDYFYTGYGLVLFDENTGYSYLMSKGLDPSGD